MQNRNKYTEIEHFIANESFRSWVCSNKDQDYWEEWTLKMLLAKLVEEARTWF
jgi:hypothetical protein